MFYVCPMFALGPSSQWVSRSYRHFQGHQRENKKKNTQENDVYGQKHV